jgi:hypothetical protein
MKIKLCFLLQQPIYRSIKRPLIFSLSLWHTRHALIECTGGFIINEQLGQLVKTARALLLYSKASSDCCILLSCLDAVCTIEYIYSKNIIHQGNHYVEGVCLQHRVRRITHTHESWRHAASLTHSLACLQPLSNILNRTFIQVAIEIAPE